MTVDERLREIKQSFRPLMNGQAAQSMRDKGVCYHLNWGVSLNELKRLSANYGKDQALAVALWKENIRECKIMATMIMPAETMPADLAQLWMEQTTTQEIAEIAAMNVYQWLPDAATLAFRWIAADADLTQIAGYCTLSRLFMRGLTPSPRDRYELLDQAHTALLADSLSVRHAANICLLRLEAL